MSAIRITLYGQRERERVRAWLSEAPDLSRVTLEAPKRSDIQSDKMWAMIGDIMKQKPDWFGPGLDKDDIKQVFMSALFKDLRMARNADGDGYVPVAHRSSRLGRQDMSNLLDLIAAWGAREGVTFKDGEQ